MAPDRRLPDKAQGAMASPAQPVHGHIPEGAAGLAVCLALVEAHVLEGGLVETHQGTAFGAYGDGDGEPAKQVPQTAAGRRGAGA